jgi:AcrR family transcriptional regulator
MSEHRSLNTRRLSSTETAIIEAFSTLVLGQRYSAIRVADIIRQAGVGKSTFYEHFKGKDDVLLSAMQPVLLALATAASGRAARSYVRPVIEHLWERRSVARPIIDSTAASLLQRRLADAIASHGGRWTSSGDTSLFAVGIAAAQLSMLRCWLAGHVTATVDMMTDQLIACSRLREGNRTS